MKGDESLLKEMERNYFENDIMDDDLTDALERENAAILEIELEMRNKPNVSVIRDVSTRKN